MEHFFRESRNLYPRRGRGSLHSLWIPSLQDPGSLEVLDWRHGRTSRSLESPVNMISFINRWVVIQWPRTIFSVCTGVLYLKKFFKGLFFHHMSFLSPLKKKVLSFPSRSKLDQGRPTCEGFGSKSLKAWEPLVVQDYCYLSFLRWIWKYCHLYYCPKIFCKLFFFWGLITFFFKKQTPLHAQDCAITTPT